MTTTKEQIEKYIKKDERIEKHMIESYFFLRIGMGLIGVALPFLIWLIALLIDKHGLLPSMSAYYHTISRDVFVGGLFAIGAAAYLYKGYDKDENIAMNLAGLSAFGVAVFPTKTPFKTTIEPLSDCSNLTNPDVLKTICTAPSAEGLHVTFALLFFILIAYVCIATSHRTIDAENNNFPEAKKKRYKLIYKVFGVLMVLLPLLVFLQSFNFMNFVNDQIVEEKNLVFWAEVAAILNFSAFWFLKSWELHQTQFDKRSLLSRYSPE